MKKKVSRFSLMALLVVFVATNIHAAEWDNDGEFTHGLFKHDLYISGPLKQFKRDVTVAATSRNIETKDSGQIFSNHGAIGEVTYDLPEAVEGLSYTFFVSANQTIKIRPASAASRIMGLTSTNGKSVTSSTVGDTITILATQPSEWEISSSYGTWVEGD